jgi:elongation factor 1-beta
MGNVLVTYRIMPEGTEVPLDKLSDQVKEVGRVALRSEVVEHPFAFGLKVLIAKFIVADGSGLSDQIEAQLGALEGVSSVECLELGLV